MSVKNMSTSTFEDFPLPPGNFDIAFDKEWRQSHLIQRKCDSITIFQSDFYTKCNVYTFINKILVVKSYKNKNETP